MNILCEDKSYFQSSLFIHKTAHDSSYATFELVVLLHFNSTLKDSAGFVFLFFNHNESEH